MQVTPWDVSGQVDYQKLIKEFGTQSLDEKLFSQLKDPKPPILKRGMFFSHRDLGRWLEFAKKDKISVVYGRGPSEKMHIGHLVPLIMAKYLQDSYGCKVYLPISDDEKFYVKKGLTFEDAETYAEDNILDIVAVGFDPKKTVIHRDFQYTKIYSFAAQIAKRITYSTAKAVFGLTPQHNIGWTFYPAMQSAHILFPQYQDGPHMTLVTIAIDQDPFMRIVRDVAEAFGMEKPAAVHSRFLPGLSGDPKMSASKGEDVIWLSDDEKTVARKINKYAFSGGAATVEEHRKKGGNPDVDVSFLYLKYLFEEDDKKLARIHDDYRSGALLTGELKAHLIEKVNAFLKEHRKNRGKAARTVDKFLRKD